MTTRELTRRTDTHGLAAALTKGPGEVLDFFLPLWAGAVLGLPPEAIGVLVASETLVSFLARPMAGRLADRTNRVRLAAAGAVVYGVSFAGYALAGGFWGAMGAAAVGGVGGALFWIALRARVAEDAADDSGAFAKLFAAEGAGTWIAFVAAITLVARIDFRGVFWLGAASCAVAAAVLLTGPSAGRRSAGPAASPFRGPGRRLRPLLAVVVVTATAEGGVALLLLLHLQQEFRLELGEIAMVFLPGFIVYSTVPELLHGVVTRLGRARVMTVALVASGVFAVVLALAPNPWVIAGAWVLAAAAFAAAIPIEQSVVAEAAGVSLGRGMAVYETATLLGVTVGTLGAGLLYGSGGWQVACVVAAVLLAGAAIAIRPALRRVGTADMPPPATTDTDDRTDDTEAPGAGPAPRTVSVTEPTTGEPKPMEATEVDTTPTDRNPTDARTDDTTAAGDVAADTRDERRPSLRNWAGHAVIFVAVQTVLVIAGYSWPWEAVFGGPHPAEWYWNSSGDWLLNLGRIWTFIFVLDTVWSLGRFALSRSRTRGPSARPGR